MDRLERQDRGKGFPVDGQHRAGEWWEPGIRYDTVTKQHHHETNVTLSLLEQLQRLKGLDVAFYKNNTKY